MQVATKHWLRMSATSVPTWPKGLLTKPSHGECLMPSATVAAGAASAPVGTATVCDALRCSMSAASMAVWMLLKV